jgi:hypothetical protein
MALMPKTVCPACGATYRDVVGCGHCLLDRGVAVTTVPTSHARYHALARTVVPSSVVSGNRLTQFSVVLLAWPPEQKVIRKSVFSSLNGLDSPPVSEVLVPRKKGEPAQVKFIPLSWEQFLCAESPVTALAHAADTLLADVGQWLTSQPQTVLDTIRSNETRLDLMVFAHTLAGEKTCELPPVFLAACGRSDLRLTVVVAPEQAPDAG